MRVVRRTRVWWWWSWLTVVVVAVGLAGAADEVDGPSPNGGVTGRGREAPSLPIEVQDVQLWREPPALRVETSGPVKPTVTVVPPTRETPPRIEVEVPAWVPGRTTPLVGQGLVRRVRLVKTPSHGTRFVIELTAPAGHRLRVNDRTITVQLRPGEAMPVVAKAAPEAAEPRLANMTLVEDPAASEASPAPPAPPAQVEHPGPDDAEPVDPAPAPELRTQEVAAPPQDDAPATADLGLTIERGARFAWPNLDAPYYADQSAAPERLALKAWRQGTPALPAPAAYGTPATLYLAADVTYLRTLLGQDEPLAGPQAYERALRVAPAFPDAPRALVMLGFANLGIGLAPEAELAFTRVVREHRDSPYAAVAAVGRASALRARRRFDEARAALAPLGDHPPVEIACDALAERAALARASGAHDEAAPLDEQVARDCPRLGALASVIEGRADSLLALGRRADARALLAQESQALTADEQARLLVRAAELAHDDGDTEGARRALDRVLGLRVSTALRSIAQAHLARLDGLVAPDRAVESLEHLAATAQTPASRAGIVEQIAETLADAGRFEAALARLGRTADADGGSMRFDARADAILARWLARLAEAGDVVGIATVYAAHRTAIDTRAQVGTTLVVADALGRVGLPVAALRLLRLRESDDDPLLALTIAEAAVAANEPVVAHEALARVADRDLATELATRRASVGVRVAILDGDLERATGEVDDTGDPLVAQALAAAWITRGDAAAAHESWETARAAYERARSIATDRVQRTTATAGLVSASAASEHAVPEAVDALGLLDDPVVKQGVALLATTRPFGGTLASAPVTEEANAR